MRIRHEQSFSQWLDAFRWMAALAVLIAHVAAATFPTSGVRGNIANVYAVFAGFSHQAVVIFFVLSGFLVGGGALNELQKTGDIRLGRYLLKRLIRLWIVVLPVLCIVVAVDSTGIASGYPLFDAAVIDAPTVGCNALFLQTIACPTLGTNDPLWSLANEFWYYLLWPAFLLAAFSKRAPVVRISLAAATGGAAVLITALQSSGHAIIPYMAIWVLGVGVSLCKRTLFRSWLANVALFLAVLAASRFLYRGLNAIGPMTFFYDAIIGISFANMIISLRALGARLRGPIGGDANVRLAAFSFTLYCLHRPLVLLVAAILDDAPTWAKIFACMLASIAAAYALSLLTERNTDRLRKAIFRKLGADQPAQEHVSGKATALAAD